MVYYIARWGWVGGGGGETCIVVSSFILNEWKERKQLGSLSSLACPPCSLSLLSIRAPILIFLFPSITSATSSHNNFSGLLYDFWLHILSRKKENKKTWKQHAGMDGSISPKPDKDVSEEFKPETQASKRRWVAVSWRKKCVCTLQVTLVLRWIFCGGFVLQAIFLLLA